MPDVDRILENNRRRMVELLSALSTSEGLRPSILDGLQLGRSSRNTPRAPVMYEPSIYIVANGRKIGFVGSRRVVYDANNYLVLSIPLPFECETEVGEDGPLLGMSVRVDVGVVSELALKMDALRRAEDEGCVECIRATPLDASLSTAAVRLLECLRSPVDAKVLGPGLMREITYRVLCGPQGHVLLAMLARHGQLAQIQSVLQRIHHRFSEPLNVQGLAEEAGMSVSAFHHHFKAVTASSPLQYLKSVRLHKARMLMVHDGVGAAVAADRVGYESASQFSREFRRFFGSSPVEESRRLMGIVGNAAPHATYGEAV